MDEFHNHQLQDEKEIDFEKRNKLLNETIERNRSNFEKRTYLRKQRLKSNKKYKEEQVAALK